MCGIVGGTAQRDIASILIEGLRRLEYRGYDSAGMAVQGYRNGLQRLRAVGKVQQLADRLENDPIGGGTGVAHTRWATHGIPSEANAHPHICAGEVALVHNGIIENHETLRAEQTQLGYVFTSQTDTEVVVHQVHRYLQTGVDLFDAVRATLIDLEGAYALGVISNSEPGRLIAARKGSPLVIGVGIGENFIASDVAALLPVTRRFIFLEEGDLADIKRDGITIYDADGKVVERPIKESEVSSDAVERGHYRHYMQKEIHEQARAVAETLEGRIVAGKVVPQVFGASAPDLFDRVRNVQIVACGTSYHAGMVARYWLESMAGLPCNVEVASEFRYREVIVQPGTLFVTISQSGETADTLAALRQASTETNYVGSLTICNVPESSLVRESDMALMTRAGPEIGVASTKAFTTQLVALMLLVIALGRRNAMSEETEARLCSDLEQLPSCVERVLTMDAAIEAMSQAFANKNHALFLGRGVQYPIAMEGALKLKEISYIHAEAYAAGELKHGPLALVDAEMPVIAVAPNDDLLDKLKSNLHEVRARGGELFVFAQTDTDMQTDESGIHVMDVSAVPESIAPIIYVIPLQLLSYHVALIKGTDVDQPRNLAKSVTVE
ncbi:MAG: glutamine--fructose-6-phosphate transaminase (isomerizing) [Gammaproteobacteria bacterium]